MNNENKKNHRHEVKYHWVSKRKIVNIVTDCDQPQTVESRYLPKTSSPKDIAGKIVSTFIKLFL
jgi:hypothetical protein